MRPSASAQKDFVHVREKPPASLAIIRHQRGSHHALQHINLYQKFGKLGDLQRAAVKPQSRSVLDARPHQLCAALLLLQA